MNKGIFKDTGSIIIIVYIIALLAIITFAPNFYWSVSGEVSQILLSVGNLIFISAISLAIAIIATRSYLMNGNKNVLFLSAGILSLGLASLSMSLVINLPDSLDNMSAIYNLGAFLSAMFHFAGAIYLLEIQPGRSRPENRRFNLVFLYSGILLLTIFITLMSVLDEFPDFYSAEAGFTDTRRVVLGLSILLFSLSAIIFLRYYFQTRNRFVYWYSMALFLFALGIFVSFLRNDFLDPIIWFSRFIHYTGSVYLLIAIIITIRSAQGKKRSPEKIISEIFENPRELYTFLGESTPDAIIAIDTDMSILLWNRAAEKIFKYSEEEAIGTGVLDLIIPDQQRSYFEYQLKNLAKTGKSSLINKMHETVFISKSGTLVPVSFTFSVKKVEDGWIAIFIIRDISEKVQYQEKLNWMEAIFKSTDDAVIGTTLDGIITSWNAGAEKMYGYLAEEILGKPLTITYPRERLAEFERVQQKIKTGASFNFETVRIKKSGEFFDISVTVSPVRDINGDIIGISHIKRDITAAKKSQRALMESEKRFRLLADSAPVMIWMAGTDKLCNYFNKVWLDFRGRTIEQEIGDGWAEGVHPEDRERCIDIYFRSFDERKPFQMEYRLQRFDGEYRWILDHGTPRFEEENIFAGYIGSCVDITERKEAEEALRKSEEELRLITDNIPGLIAYVDAEQRYQFCNKIYEDWFGVSREYFIGKYVEEVLDKSVYRNIKPKIEEALKGYPQIYETEGIFKNNSKKNLYVTYIPHRNNGKVMGIYILIMDITSRKEAEKALQKAYEQMEIRVQERTRELQEMNEVLKGEIQERTAIEKQLRENEKLLKTVLEALPVGVWIADKNGQIISTNSAGKHIWGGAKFVGPEQYQEYKAWWADTGKPITGEDWALARLFKKGETSIGEIIKIQCFDGTQKTILNSAIPMREENGELLGAVVVNEDITEVKKNEEALRKSEEQLRYLSSQLITAQETERKFIAQELHDSISQSLTAIKYGTERTLEQISEKTVELAKASLKNLLPIIDNLISEVYQIQTNLRPPMLDAFGLLSSLEWFCEEFQKIYFIQVEDQIRVEEEKIPENLRIVLFRIIQEAFNNIAKHSQASLVTLFIQSNNGHLELLIRDNGKGFEIKDIYTLKKFSTGLGLVSMRERAEHSGGKFVIESHDGAGTTIKVTWPTQE